MVATILAINVLLLTAGLKQTAASSTPDWMCVDLPTENTCETICQGNQKLCKGGWCTDTGDSCDDVQDDMCDESFDDPTNTDDYNPAQNMAQAATGDDSFSANGEVGCAVPCCKPTCINFSGSEKQLCHCEQPPPPAGLIGSWRNGISNCPISGAQYPEGTIFQNCQLSAALVGTTCHRCVFRNIKWSLRGLDNVDLQHSVFYEISIFPEPDWVLLRTTEGVLSASGFFQHTQWYPGPLPTGEAYPDAIRRVAWPADKIISCPGCPTSFEKAILHTDRPNPISSQKEKSFFPDGYFDLPLTQLEDAALPPCADLAYPSCSYSRNVGLTRTGVDDLAYEQHLNADSEPTQCVPCNTTQACTSSAAACPATCAPVVLRTLGFDEDFTSRGSCDQAVVAGSKCRLECGDKLLIGLKVYPDGDMSITCLSSGEWVEPEGRCAARDEDVTQVIFTITIVPAGGDSGGGEGGGSMVPLGNVTDVLVGVISDHPDIDGTMVTVGTTTPSPDVPGGTVITILVDFSGPTIGGGGGGGSGNGTDINTIIREVADVLDDRSASRNGGANAGSSFSITKVSIQFPSSPLDAIFEQEWEVLIPLFLGMTLFALICVHLHNKKWEGGEPQMLFVTVLGYADMMSDVTLLVWMASVPGLSHLLLPSAISLSATLLVSSLMVLRRLGKLRRNNGLLQKWEILHPLSSKLIPLFSLINVALLGLLHSKLFGLAPFTAPITPRDQRKIARDGLAIALLEDLPQLFIQFQVMREVGLEQFSSQKQLLLPFFFSVLSFLVSITRRMYHQITLYTSSSKRNLAEYDKRMAEKKLREGQSLSNTAEI